MVPSLERSKAQTRSGASLVPANFKEMVLQIRSAEKMLGDGKKIPQICEIQNRKVIRRSLVAGKDLRAMSMVTWTNVESLRLTGGIPSEDLIKVIGKTFKKNLKKGQQIYLSDLI